MKVLVSACLMGTNCKYSGGNNRSEALLEFLTEKEVIPVCPEVMGGLPIPRKPGEIVDGVVRNRDGNSVDYEYRTGAAAAFKIAEDENIDLAVLQSRSPSCGPKQIYDGSFSGRLIDGHGVFADMLIKAGYTVLDIEDLEKAQSSK